MESCLQRFSLFTRESYQRIRRRQRRETEEGWPWTANERSSWLRSFLGKRWLCVKTPYSKRLQQIAFNKMPLYKKALTQNTFKKKSCQDQILRFCRSVEGSPLISILIWHQKIPVSFHTAYFSISIKIYNDTLLFPYKRAFYFHNMWKKLFPLKPLF